MLMSIAIKKGCVTVNKQKLLPNERHDIILRALHEQGRVLAVEMAKQLNTTEATVRRDLRHLAEQQLCKRIYGGALALSPSVGKVSQRFSISSDEKQRLARNALKLIAAGQVIFLDAGSTHAYLAALLPDDKDLTVVTNAIAVAANTIERSGIRTILIGGEVNTEVGGCIDVKAAAEVEEYYFDLAFLGICAYEPASGFSSINYQDAQFKRRVMTRSGSVAILCTADKFNKFAPYSFSSAEQVDYMVVNDATNLSDRNQFIQCGVKIISSKLLTAGKK